MSAVAYASVGYAGALFTQLEVRMVPGAGEPQNNAAIARATVDEWREYAADPSRWPRYLRGILAAGLVPVNVHRLKSAENLPASSDPGSLNSRLARYVFIDFAGELDKEILLRAVSSSPHVQSAHVSYGLPMGPDPLLGTPGGFDPPESYQWGMHALELPDAWEWSSGNALIAILDNGIDVVHEDLVAFDAQGHYVGGNFVSGRGYDFGSNDGNIDENQPSDLSPGCSDQSYPPYIGHGTHVAGIIAETTGNGIGGAGACPQCKLFIAKVTELVCTKSFQLAIALRPDATIDAANHVMDGAGAQIMNLSAGYDVRYAGDCLNNIGNATEAYCDMLEKATKRDVIFVAASGNDKTDLDFPARESTESTVVSAGGIETTFALWDEAPDCPPGYLPPYFLPNTECGSNFTTSAHWNWRQELVAPAKSVLSTFYLTEPAAVWSSNVGCLDDDDPEDEDSTTYDDLPGYGFCTGTSMAAPHISGFFGVLRSLNPLLHAGSPTGDPDTLRYIAASTTFENLGNPTPVWDPEMGYGRPDAYQAVRKILGTIGGVQAKNRITPLFGVYGTNALDSAYSTAPQAMVAFSQNGTGGYDVAIGSPIPGYSTFPHESGISVFTPKAPMYIFTSHQAPVYQGPDLLPLYRMARSRSFPVNCSPGAGCNEANRDFTYAVSASEIEDYHDDGFGLEKLEGYIFEPCNSGITVCPVPGTKDLYRMYNPTTDDTALVLEPQHAGYVSDGYSIEEVIGSAYPPGDNDAGIGDGFIDSYELTVGLDPDSIDTDCDGLSDGAEWPLASIAMNSGAPASRDPLNGTCTYPVSVKTAADTNPTGLKVRNAGSNDASGVAVLITVGSVSMNLNVSIIGGPSCVPTPVIGGGGYIGAQSQWICAVGDLDSTDTASWSIQTSCGAIQGPTPMVTATIDVMHVDQPDVDPTDNRTESVFFCGDPV